MSADVSAEQAASLTVKKNKAQVDIYGRQAMEKTITDAVSLLRL